MQPPPPPTARIPFVIFPCRRCRRNRASPKGRTTKRQSCQDRYVSLNLNVCLVGVVHCCAAFGSTCPVCVRWRANIQLAILTRRRRCTSRILRVCSYEFPICIHSVAARYQNDSAIRVLPLPLTLSPSASGAYIIVCRKRSIIEFSVARSDGTYSTIYPYE